MFCCCYLYPIYNVVTMSLNNNIYPRLSYYC